MKERSFEDNLKRVEEIISRLEESQLPLKESTALFEEAMDLISMCEKELDETEDKVNSIILKSNH